MAENLTLDSLVLNDNTTLRLELLDMTPPPETEEWISGIDSDGALLAREPKVPNRVIECRLRVVQQTTMNLALQKVALIVDKLKESQRNANGLALTWVPSTSTLPTVTFRCLSGQVTGVPITESGDDAGWFQRSPVVTVRFTCLPFWEGAEASMGSVTSSAPIISLEVTGVGGDVPALARAVVTDAASKDRRYAAIGMESRWYPTSSPPSLIVDSSSMVTSGYAGTTATRTAAYSGATNNVISAVMRTQPQAVCGLGNLTHVGAFRPQLRFYCDATTIALRLSYKTLDGPLRSLSYKIPVVTGFNHVDLGLVTIPQAILGSQRWTGQVDAYSTATGGETFQVDAVWMMPAELFGRARGVYAYQPGLISGYDDFTATTAGSNLNARVAPVGGTWATAGSATDFQFADGPGAAEETVKRTTNAAEGPTVGRTAILGSTNFTNVEAGVRYWVEHITEYSELYIRWTDANNWARLRRQAGQFFAQLQICIAGTVTNLGGQLDGVERGTWQGLRVVCYASGRIIGSLLDANGGVISSSAANHSSLATGGTLATGKAGFGDTSQFSGANDRYYDAFYVGAPAPEPVVCYSSQSIEFRHDAVLREDSTGTYYGPPPEYVGARFLLPPAGGPGRKARIAAIVRRNDIETAADDDLTSNATTDSTTLQVYATPRGLVVPR